MAALDDLLPADHIARLVWELVQGLDLHAFYDLIQSVEGEAGRPAIDPAILVSLWLLATVDGVGSARRLERLCQEQIGYSWIVGGVTVNYHTLADFRVQHEKELDELLIKHVTVLSEQGLVSLERTAQDGVRIRASAGSGSFRRRATLEKRLKEGQEYVEALKKQEPSSDSQASSRQQAARQRARQEKVVRLQKSLKEIEQLERQTAKNHKKKSERKAARTSMTDPQARVMKMPDGGFRPAFNGQLGVDTSSGIILAVEVTNQVDRGQMIPMLDKIESQYHRRPKEHLVDGGFATQDDLVESHRRGISVYAPLPNLHAEGQNASLPRDNAPQAIQEWRQRMTTEAAKQIYKHRAATVEFANAGLRNRGLYQLTVRGIRKARSVMLWFALVHNLLTQVRLAGRAV
ncbi:MAG: IS1182 family transposase [Anaerolineales bacterium]|nr:IS1182 family transposase [Anaerolineales bacterium]